MSVRYKAPVRAASEFFNIQANRLRTISSRGFSQSRKWFVRHIYRGHNERGEFGRDPILEAVGDVGVWQVVVVIVMTMFNMPSTLQLILPEVEAMENSIGNIDDIEQLSYWCRKPASVRNITVKEWIEISGTKRPSMIGGFEYNPCAIKNIDYTKSYREIKNATSKGEIPCQSWHYSKLWWTIIAEWNLGCSKIPVNTISESVFSAGTAFNCIFIGYLADRYGRRGVLLVSQFIQILAVITGVMVPKYEFYLIWRYVQGAVCGALMICSSVLCIEVSGGKWKSMMSVAYMYSNGLGYFTLAALAQFITNWKHLELIIAVLSIVLFSFWWFIPESPRWLLVKKNLDGLSDLLESAASMNTRPLPDGIMMRIKEMKVLKVRSRNRVKLKMLIRTPVMKYLTIITPFIFFFINVTYYGLTLRQVTLFSVTNNLHILMIKGVLEILATTAALLLPYSSEIWNFVIVTGIAGILCLASACWPSKGSISMVLFTVARIFSSITNTSLAMTIATYYPTMIRMTGLGSGYLGVGLALFVATNAVDLGRYSEKLPQIIYGTSALIGAFLLLALPNELYAGTYDLINQMEEAYENMEYPQPKQPDVKDETGTSQDILMKYFPWLKELEKIERELNIQQKERETTRKPSRFFR